MVAAKTEKEKEKPIREASKREKVVIKKHLGSTIKYLGGIIQGIFKMLRDPRTTNLLLALFTLMLVVVAFQSLQVSKEFANITEEFYEYKSPNVSVIYGSVVKLYVLNNESYETYLTIVGLSQVYNSGTADDDAFVRQQYWGLGTNTTIERDLGFSLIFVQEGEVIQRIRPVEKINARLNAEGSPYPVPVRAGGPAVEIPILLTSSTKEKFESNSTLNLIIGEDIRIEVIDPINKNIIANETALEHTNITYVMGEKTAKMETSDGRLLTMDVRYTDDVDTYKFWKKTFLSDYGIDVPVLINPKKL